MRRGNKPCKGLGLMRHQMTIWAPSTPTTTLETMPTWTNQTTSGPVPATKRYLTNQGVESVVGDEVQAMTRYRVDWMYRGDVLPTYRLRFATTSGTDQVMEVVSVGDPEGTRSIESAECKLLEST